MTRRLCHAPQLLGIFPICIFPIYASAPHPCYNSSVTKPPKSPADQLADLGLRRTPVRLAVLEILARETQPLSAPRILEQLPQGTDNVTLYRTLNTFTEKKLLHRVRGDDQVWRYGL